MYEVSVFCLDFQQKISMLLGTFSVLARVIGLGREMTKSVLPDKKLGDVALGFGP